MIFVILGTQDKPFCRLIKQIEKLVIQNKIKEKVIVQAGTTKYDSKVIEILNIIPMEKFNELIEKSDYIITHGGVGAILDSLKKGKKIIAVPRLVEYKEHTNNHQLEITEKFSKEGYIISWNNINELEDKIKEIKNFTPKKYIGNNKRMINTIESFIEKIS